MHRILVITGEGKGKSSSAFGMVLRALGHGMKVSVIQFIKKRTDTGEVAALSQIPNAEICQFGLGFLPPKLSPKYIEHKKIAQKGLAFALERLSNPEYDMIVLDEICSTVYHELLMEQDILSAIRSASENKIIICTGRYAPESLINIADTVSKVDLIKHAYDKGIHAQPGVEF
jgi:cob(I)alamin adenosyltransferase